MSDLSDSSSSASSLNINEGGGTMAADRRHSVARIVHWTCSVILLGLSVYLVVLALSDGVALFDLHPICMGIAFLVLFPQAIALFEPDYYRSINHKQRVQFHLYTQIAAIVCTAIGFVAVYVNKNLLGKHHFKSYHGICGLAVMILVFVVGLGGSLAFYSFSLRSYIRPVLLKIYHSFGGILTIIVGNLTVILGFYSHWYSKNGNVNLIWVIISVLVLSSILLLRRSVVTLKDRVMSIFVRNNL